VQIKNIKRFRGKKEKTSSFKTIIRDRFFGNSLGGGKFSFLSMEFLFVYGTETL
jgi:hypothetical protein